MIEMKKIDVVAEISKYGWQSARWTAEKFIAASPFRVDRRPSFFVNINPDSEYYGTWHDSGAIDPEWQSGTFVKLLAYLRGESIAETVEYLRLMYGDMPATTDTYEMRELRPVKLTSSFSDASRCLSPSVLEQYKTPDGTCEYLTRRGIHKQVQRLMRIGYCERLKAVTIPWFTSNGRLGTVMYRSTVDKRFWFRKDGIPAGNLIYGLNLVYERRIQKVAIVEAPIDAMTIMSAGMMAIATGGTAFNRHRAEMIIRSPIRELIIVRDRDGPGYAWQKRIVSELADHVDIYIAKVPAPHKDVNEAWIAGISIKDFKLKKFKKNFRIFVPK